MRVLAGYIENLQRSGIDKFLLNVLSIAKEKNIQLDFLSSVYDENAVSYLNDLGVKVHKVHSLKTPLKHFNDVKNIIKEGKYDRAYFNISEPLNMCGALASHSLKIKTIIHAHASSVDENNKIKRIIRIVINKICRLVLHKAGDTLLACSNKAGEWMYPKSARNTNKYNVIYNFVDGALFNFAPNPDYELRHEFNIADSTLLVGFTGSFCYVKNNFFLIDIMRELIKKEPNSKMLLIGTGEDFEAVRNKAASLSLQENMLFLGVRKDWPRLIRMLDVFILPSRAEGFPLVALEAQLTGIPTIISNNIDDAVAFNNAVSLSIDSASKWADMIINLSKSNRFEPTAEMKSLFSLEHCKEEIFKLVFGG